MPVVCPVMRRCSRSVKSRCSFGAAAGCRLAQFPKSSPAVRLENLQTTAAAFSMLSERERPFSARRSMSTSTSSSGNSHPLFSSYSAFCKEANLQNDPVQRACIQQMVGIYDAATSNPSRTRVAVRRKPPSSNAKPKQVDNSPGRGMFSGLSSMFGSGRPKTGKPVAPKTQAAAAWETATVYPGQTGLYLYGGCGCGKTVLLDLMYRTLLDFQADFPVRRLHWHEFVRDGLRLTKDAPPDVEAFDWLADKTSAECKVLLLDELMITHISEAMLVRELFTSLWSRGVVTCVSSNYKPEDLYGGGLNRVVIEPFLQGDLQRQMPLFNFSHDASSQDFRTLCGAAEGSSARFVLADGAQQMDMEFEALVGDAAAPLDLTVPNEGATRKLPIQHASSFHGVARLRFDELCRQARGRAEYSALAENFHTVFIDAVPKMTAEEDGIEFQRFASLIDILYDKKVKLHMQSEVPCTVIYQPPAYLEAADALWETPFFVSGQAGDALWAWKRTQNKLNEMSSDVWPKICEVSRDALLSSRSGTLME